MVICVFLWFWLFIREINVILAFFFGLVLTLNGVLFLPKGKLFIDDNILLISGMYTKVDLNLIKEIKISKARIIFIDTKGKFYRINNLEIDESYAESIKKYAAERLKNFDSIVKIEI